MEPASVRIASLLPSLTEIIAAIPSLRNKIVAVTHECDYPPDVTDKATAITTSFINPKTMSQAEIDRRVKGSLAVGHSLYGLDEAKLETANPTIVFTQQLCDVCAVAYPKVLSTCAKVLGDNPRIVSIEPSCLEDVINSVRTVGSETGTSAEAETVAQQLEASFERIRVAVKGLPRPKVAFLEWTDPLYNSGHWMPDVLDIAGTEYTMCQTKNRSVEITPEALVEYDADWILVAPCGFTAERAAADAQQLWKHSWWTNLRAVKNNRVYALDGNAYYARPGPRLLQGCGIVARLVHGDSMVEAIGEDIALKQWIHVQPSDNLSDSTSIIGSGAVAQ